MRSAFGVEHGPVDKSLPYSHNGKFYGLWHKLGAAHGEGYAVTHMTPTARAAHREGILAQTERRTAWGTEEQIAPNAQRVSHPPERLMTRAQYTNARRNQRILGHQPDFAGVQRRFSDEQRRQR